MTDLHAIPALRVVVPEHVLTICGSEAGKVGSCRCGSWSVVGVKGPSASDDVSRFFILHLDDVGQVHPSACDVCLRRLATIRLGCVDMCGRCAVDEFSRNVDVDVDVDEELADVG